MIWNLGRTSGRADNDSLQSGHVWPRHAETCWSCGVLSRNTPGRSTSPRPNDRFGTKLLLPHHLREKFGPSIYFRCYGLLWVLAQTRTVYKKSKCRDRRRTLLPQAVMYIDWVWFRCLWTFKAFLVGTFFPHSGQSKPPVFKCLDSMWILTQLRCFEVYSQSLHPWLPSLVLSSLDVTRASIISPPTYSKN